MKKQQFEMESRETCALCNTKCEKLFTSEEKHLRSKPAFNIIKDYLPIGYYVCAKCNYLWQSPRLSEKGSMDLYINFDKIFTFETSEKQTAAKRRKWIYQAKVVKALKIKEMLDFGSGTGEFAQVCKDNGVDVEIYDIKFQNKYDKKKFEFIGIDNVLEHVWDPVKVMAHVTTMSKKGTIFYLAVPNCKEEVKKIETRTLTQVTKDIMSLIHTNGFTPKSLTKLMDIYNLKKISTFKLTLQLLPTLRSKDDIYWFLFTMKGHFLGTRIYSVQQ